MIKIPVLLIFLFLATGAFAQGSGADKQNKKSQSKLNSALAKELELIYDEDQKHRLQMDSIETKYGWESKEMKELWRVATHADSLNLIKVNKILDKHGWLGPQVVGSKGNDALFLVIQHADPKTQNYYLPVLQEAVKNGNARGSQLALLTDRVALGNGKKQIYGSQLMQDPKTQTYMLSPLEDPDHVDERRAKMGLGPIADYLKQWKIEWNVEAFKKAAEN